MIKDFRIYYCRISGYRAYVVYNRKTKMFEVRDSKFRSKICERTDEVDAISCLIAYEAGCYY